MNVYNYKSYKKFLLSYIKTLPNKGRGELTKISKALNIHNTTLSQVLKGDKNFNQEQGIELANYLNFNLDETNFLLLLINYERAGSHKLKSYITNQISDFIEKKDASLSFDKPPDHQIDTEVKSRFYSYWGYSALRILSSIPEYQTLDSLSSRSGISKKRTKEILDFLVDHHLCIRKANKYMVGPLHTHIDRDDPFINLHRLNWRSKAIERFGDLCKNEFAFSAPMSLSQKDYNLIKSKVNDLAKEIVEMAKGSKPQVAACLNIDWIKI